MAGRDVLGKARTGSGKTLGFGLPLLARLATMSRPEPRHPFAIILVPTRELAMQVGDALEPYTHALGLTQRLVAGGLSMSKQIVSLERGVHLVVATPGRLADLMRRGHVSLGSVQIAVLDEADHMAEMGFGEEIAELLAQTPEGGQRLLFSATLDGVVDQIVSRFMSHPVLHDVTSGTDLPTQRHVVLSIPPHEKYQTATRIAARDGRTLCFVRTKLAADRVAEQMRDAGVLAVALHGDRSQHERNLAMTEFRAGRLPVLVATDVAARGIHVDAVDLVLQIDPPADFRDYTHRSGRTGRAGADGLAVTMILPHQRATFTRVLEKANIKAEQAAFRNIDAAALAEIDALTGAREPSWVRVFEPVAPAKFDPRASRGGRPGRDKPARDKPARDRPGRDRPSYDRGTRDSRPPRANDREFDAKAQALEAREREIAERERRLAEREAAAAAMERDAAKAAKAVTTRAPREERAPRQEPYRASTQRGSSASRGAPSRGARDERPARQWTERPSGGEEKPRYGAAERPTRQWKDRQSDGPAARPARGGDDRPQRAWTEKPPRAHDDRGSRKAPSSDAAPARAPWDGDEPRTTPRGDKPFAKGKGAGAGAPKSAGKKPVNRAKPTTRKPRKPKS